MDLASLPRATEDWTSWEGVVAKSSVVPLDLAKLWDILD